MITKIKSNVFELINYDLSNGWITIVAENGKDNYSFKQSAIIFIASAGNYFEVYERTTGATKDIDSFGF